MALIEYRFLGRTREKVSAIGLGTYGVRDYERMLGVLVQAHSYGLSLIDTAEMYGNGEAERLVGRLVREVGREELFIVTKLLPQRFVSPETAVRAAENSLRRIGVKAVDLVLIHWPHWQTPIRIQVRSLEAIAMKGLTRYIGVSNFDSLELSSAIESTVRHEIVADQVKYSVLDRWVEKDLLPFSRELGVTIQAYTPLERCLVSTHPILLGVAMETGRTPVQIALNYLLSQENVIPIVKTEDPQHLEEILGSLGWRLSPAHILLLRGEDAGKRPL